MESNKTLVFLLQADASTENSNGIAKIIINIIKRWENYKFKFVIFGKPLPKSIYSRYGKTTYLNKKDNITSYLKNKFYRISKSDKAIITSSCNREDIILVFGSFVNLNLLSRYRCHQVRICLVDSSARYYFKFKTKNLVKWLIAKTCMLNLEIYYELMLRWKGYKICYVSENDRSFLKIFNEKCHVIENGVFIEQFKWTNIPKRISRLVFVGNLDYAPNKQAVEFIIKNLCDRLPDFTFYVVGNGCERLKELYRNRGNLIFTGYVANLRTYFDKGSIFISPIFSGTGLQNKILDAFAHKVPVIASSSSIAGIKCLPNVHYLPANSADEFVQSIEMLAVSHKRQQELVCNASDLINKKYNWDIVSQKYEEFIIDK
jgi:glycosyltransferase involved in cell wall biosynthesis